LKHGDNNPSAKKELPNFHKKILKGKKKQRPSTAAATSESSPDVEMSFALHTTSSKKLIDLDAASSPDVVEDESNHDAAETAAASESPNQRVKRILAKHPPSFGEGQSN
jgi:hypothetical protein